MANLADCAVAIAKSDLGKMQGAVEKVEDDDGKDKYEHAVRSQYKVDGKNDKWTLLHENGYNGAESYDHYTLKKNGEVVTATDKWAVINEAIDGFGLVKEWDKTKVLRDNFTSNGWKVDWLKLNSYSYDYTPYVHEYEDHITIYFGGRWDFPSSLEDKLNEYGVLWQGAGCEDGCDWEYDEFGNSDFGLRIKREKSDYVDDDGTEYWNRYVEDTSV